MIVVHFCAESDKRSFPIDGQMIDYYHIYIINIPPDVSHLSTRREKVPAVDMCARS